MSVKERTRAPSCHRRAADHIFTVAASCPDMLSSCVRRRIPISDSWGSHRRRALNLSSEFASSDLPIHCRRVVRGRCGQISLPATPERPDGA